MVNVLVYKQRNFPVSVKKIKEAAAKTLTENGMVSDCEVSIAIVGKPKMSQLSKQYLHEEKVFGEDHPVLAFTESEVQGYFVFPPNEKMQVGEIVVSYPKAVEIASKENKLVDDVVCSLVEHGALHLIGIHHA